MSKTHDLTPLATLLESVRAGAKGQARCGIDRESWRQALGDRLARSSEPEAMHGKTLTVVVASSVWAQELSLLAPEILKRLQEAGFSISELRWRVGQPKPALVPRSKPDRFQPLRSLPNELQRALATVRDAELRTAISEAAAHIMGREQRVARRDSVSARPLNARAPRSAEPKTSQRAQDGRDPHVVSRRIRAKRRD